MSSNEHQQPALLHAAIGRASPFSRALLVAYVVLIIYASWYPFVGWESDGWTTLDAALVEWPHYWTRFDAMTNVLGYIPLGVLVVFALYPWRQRVLSVLIAALAGVALSLLVECVQHFLPTRVTSILDILTNAVGSLIGAIIGIALIPPILERGRLQLLKKEWLHRDASHEMVVLGLWTAAQIYPQPYLFGLGQVFPILSEWISEALEVDFDLGSLLRQDVDLSAEQYLFSESFITAFGCTGALLMCMHLFKNHAPKFWLTLALFAAAIAVKSLATAILFKPEYAFVWLTPGAQGGLLISAIMLYGFAFSPVVVQKRAAAFMLILALVFVNVVPSNPYFDESLQGWAQGKFLNFNGAAQFLSLIWPLLALWYLLRQRKPV
jgi:VanZ family protein